VPLTGTTAAECAAALFSGWIQRFGVPETITSDRGAQFTSSLWAALCRLLDISHRPTTAYHPQSNGLVERFHRRLKDALRARCASSDWHTHLPWVMLGIRAAWRLDGSYSPAEAIYGAQPVLPGQYLAQPEPPAAPFLSDLQDVLTSRQPRATSHHCQPGPPQLPDDLLRSRFVLVRRDAVQPPLQPLYDGPYLVLERSLRFFSCRWATRRMWSPQVASNPARRRLTPRPPCRRGAVAPPFSGARRTLQRLPSQGRRCDSTCSRR